MSSQPVTEKYRSAVAAIATFLIDGRYAEAVATAPSRLSEEELEQAMRLTNEELRSPTGFREALQIGAGPGAELFVPFETPSGAAADLELQLRVAQDDRLEIWDILVP